MLKPHWLIVLTTKAAERHTRRACNVPDAHGLGWRPYRFLVQGYGAIALGAGHTGAEIKRQFPGMRLAPARRYAGERRDGVSTFRVLQDGEA